MLLSLCAELAIELEQTDFDDGQMVRLESTRSLLAVVDVAAFMPYLRLTNAKPRRSHNRTETEEWLVRLIRQLHHCQQMIRYSNNLAHVLLAQEDISEEHGPWQPAVFCPGCGMALPGPKVYAQHFFS